MIAVLVVAVLVVAGGLFLAGVASADRIRAALARDHGQHHAPHHSEPFARARTSLVTPPDGLSVAETRQDYDMAPHGKHARLVPREPGATLGRAPWETGSFQVPADVALVPVYNQASVATVLERERLERVMQP